MATLSERRRRLALAWTLTLLPGAGAAIILRAPLIAAAILPALAAFVLRATAEKIKFLRPLALGCLATALLLLLANDESRTAFAQSGMARIILALQAFIFTLLAVAPPLPRILVHAASLAMVEIIIISAGESPWLLPLAVAFFAIFVVFWLQMEAAVFPAPFALQFRAPPPSLSGRRRRVGVGRYSRRSAAGLVIAVIGGGALLFAALPRFSPVGWHQLLMPSEGEKSTGSDNRTALAAGVEMDMRGPFSVTLSAEELLRVRLSDAQGNDLPDMDELRLRGWVYDVYQNGVWLRSGEFHEIHDADDGSQDGWVSAAAARDMSRLIRQTIEPQIRQTVICGMPRICFVQAPALRRDMHGNLAPAAHAAPLRYVVLSDTLAAERTLAELSRLVTYRALPPAFVRAADIARAIVKPEDDALAACNRFAAYLRDNFEYTLEVEGGHGQDPLDIFFAQRHGCCMHFATAMVAMARGIGLPARLAGGYYTTEKEGDGNLFIVRRMHAHAWAEVWIDKIGWCSIDATPAGALRSDEAPSVPPAAPSALLASVDEWLRSIAMYGQEERQLLFAFIWQAKWPFALLACALLSGWLWRRLRCRGFFVPREQTGKDRPDLAFFGRYLRVLEKLGLQRRFNETASELAKRASVCVPEEAVQTITAMFEKMRYGDADLAIEEENRLQEALHNVEAAGASARIRQRAEISAIARLGCKAKAACQACLPAARRCAAQAGRNSAKQCLGSQFKWKIWAFCLSLFLR